MPARWRQQGCFDMHQDRGDHHHSAFGACGAFGNSQVSAGFAAKLAGGTRALVTRIERAALAARGRPLDDARCLGARAVASADEASPKSTEPSPIASAPMCSPSQFDAATYRQHLEGLDLTEEQQTELLTILWRIFDDISRLARGLDAHLQLHGAIASARGVLESPSIEFGEDSDSMLVENLLASVSQHQRQKNGEQTVNRMRARVMNGYWPFACPVGYRYEKVSGHGKMLVRKEPLAAIVQEALEGYASGRFQIQAEVKRFLESRPEFPKTRAGIVLNQDVTRLLTRAVYAGYVAAPRWDVFLCKGHHEALVSFETFRKIQDRLEGHAKVPARKNLSKDFPLRGFVTCADCGTPLTACWTKGCRALYPYYLCPKHGCPSYRKSVRRELLEGQFESLLRQLQPSENLICAARVMIKDLWDHRMRASQSQAQSLNAAPAQVERKIEQLLDRVTEANVASVIRAYEDRIRKLEEQKAEIVEQIANCGRPGAQLRRDSSNCARLPPKPLETLEFRAA